MNIPPTAICETDHVDAQFMDEQMLKLIRPKETFDLSRLPTYITSQKSKNIQNIKEILKIKAQERNKK